MKTAAAVIIFHETTTHSNVKDDHDKTTVGV